MEPNSGWTLSVLSPIFRKNQLTVDMSNIQHKCLTVLAFVFKGHFYFLTPPSSSREYAAS